jgi:ribose 5-phosphate isomerase A
LDEITALKKQAAEYAVDQYIQSGMVVGLGVGSTAIFAIQHLAKKLQAGTLQNIVGIPCAHRIEVAAREAGIPLTTLEAHPNVDVTIDGADEVDPQLNVIKGGGGALLHEKIVAQNSREEIIVVDAHKQVPVLGTHWAVPIEVVPFGWGAQTAFLKTLGGQPKLRLKDDGTPYWTNPAALRTGGNAQWAGRHRGAWDVSGIGNSCDRGGKCGDT